MAKAKAKCRNCPFCDIITDNDYCKKMVCRKTSKRGKTIVWSMCCYNSNTLKYFSDWVDSHKTPSWCPEKNGNKKTKTRRERNAEILKKAKHISFKKLVERVKELPFNHTISIAEDAESEEGWWNITKLDIGDGKTLLCNYYGGGYPYSFSIDEQNDFETVEYALKEFFSFAFNINEANGSFNSDMDIAVDFEGG